MITQDQIFKRAKELAAAAAARDGLDEWCVQEVHIRLAKQQLTEIGAAVDRNATMDKRAPAGPSDDSLLAKGLEAQLRRINGTAPHPRTNFGEIEVGDDRKRVIVEHDKADDAVTIAGVSVNLVDWDSDLRSSFAAASSAFLNAEQDAEAQANARSLIGLVISAALDRHAFIGSKVRERRQARR